MESCLDARQLLRRNLHERVRELRVALAPEIADAKVVRCETLRLVAEVLAAPLSRSRAAKMLTRCNAGGQERVHDSLPLCKHHPVS